MPNKDLVPPDPENIYSQPRELIPSGLELSPLDSSEQSSEQLETASMVNEADQKQLAEVREKLGIKQETVAVKPEQREILENIKTKLKRLALDIEEFPSTLSRNGFPRMRFERDELLKPVSGESVDENLLLRGLGNMTDTFARIKLPEDMRDLMALEPHHYRKVLQGLETLATGLSRAKGALQDPSLDKNHELIQEIDRATSKIRRATELFQDGQRVAVRHRR